jgi:hypothetical protein
VIVLDGERVFEPVELLDGVADAVPDGDFVPDLVSLDERVGVADGDAPLEIVAVDEAVILVVFEGLTLEVGVNDDDAVFVGVIDEERVGLTEAVPLRVVLPVTVPERELV